MGQLVWPSDAELSLSHSLSPCTDAWIPPTCMHECMRLVAIHRLDCVCAFPIVLFFLPFTNASEVHPSCTSMHRIDALNVHAHLNPCMHGWMHRWMHCEPRNILRRCGKKKIGHLLAQVIMHLVHWLQNADIKHFRDSINLNWVFKVRILMHRRDELLGVINYFLNQSIHFDVSDWCFTQDECMH